MPWSDCFRRSLIWVCTFCQATSVKNFRTLPNIMWNFANAFAHLVHKIWKMIKAQIKNQAPEAPLDSCTCRFNPLYTSTSLVIKAWPILYPLHSSGVMNAVGTEWVMPWLPRIILVLTPTCYANSTDTDKKGKMAQLFFSLQLAHRS